MKPKARKMQREPGDACNWESTRVASEWKSQVRNQASLRSNDQMDTDDSVTIEATNTKKRGLFDLNFFSLEPSLPNMDEKKSLVVGCAVELGSELGKDDALGYRDGIDEGNDVGLFDG